MGTILDAQRSPIFVVKCVQTAGSIRKKQNAGLNNSTIKTHIIKRTCGDCDAELAVNNKSGFCIRHSRGHYVCSESAREKWRESGKRVAQINKETK